MQVYLSFLKPLLNCPQWGLFENASKWLDLTTTLTIKSEKQMKRSFFLNDATNMLAPFQKKILHTTKYLKWKVVPYIG